MDFDLVFECLRGGDGDRLADGIGDFSCSGVLLRGDGVFVACRFFLSEFDVDLSCLVEFFSCECER